MTTRAQDDAGIVAAAREVEAAWANVVLCDRGAHAGEHSDDHDEWMRRYAGAHDIARAALFAAIDAWAERERDASKPERCMHGVDLEMTCNACEE